MTAVWWCWGGVQLFIFSFPHNGSDSNPKGFSVAHFNARSVKNKISEIEIMMYQNKIDIMTLSETWLTRTTEDIILNIQGYELYRADRAAGLSVTKGGGLMTYVNAEYKTSTSKYPNLMKSTPDIESQIIQVTRDNHKSVVIINLYRPPSGSLPNFLEYIKEIIPIIALERYSDIYILGDLNLDHSNLKRTKQPKPLNNY